MDSSCHPLADFLILGSKTSYCQIRVRLGDRTLASAMCYVPSQKTRPGMAHEGVAGRAPAPTSARTQTAPRTVGWSHLGRQVRCPAEAARQQHTSALPAAHCERACLLCVIQQNACCTYHTPSAHGIRVSLQYHVMCRCGQSGQVLCSGYPSHSHTTCHPCPCHDFEGQRVTPSIPPPRPLVFIRQPWGSTGCQTQIGYTFFCKQIRLLRSHANDHKYANG